MDAGVAIFDPTIRGNLDEAVDRQTKKDASEKTNGQSMITIKMGLMIARK